MQHVTKVRNCKLVGLNDLDQGSEYVRGKIVDFMNTLVGWGVAGFRGTEYTGNGRVTEFKYGKYLGEAFRGSNELRWLSNFHEGWGMLHRDNSVVFIDNHDNQRGHGAGGDMILTFRVSRWYKMANAFMLAWPYGFTRVMSSYYWDQWWENGQDKNDWIGPPHDGSFNIISPSINADGSCGNGWDLRAPLEADLHMVEFRNVAHGTDMNDWWDNGSNQIAFCRGNKGFLAINNDGWDLKGDAAGP
ncbi:alpha-amylase [Penaeus vannamei]|uniref:Alpha-amylase n=1 Tax=Penaeus vannamei TaxID=6689 RepID=A0A3R7SVK4_PENVA|nr:alpha-amylase [Penaeus vannamei]